MGARVRLLAGLVLLAAAVGYLIHVVDTDAVGSALAAALAAPLGIAVAAFLYAAAFGLRTLAWCRMLPGLSAGQSWAALHVSLLGNHVLPLRLGEVLRVTSVLRRTTLPAREVIASAVTLRVADLLAVVTLAVAGAPALLRGPWIWAVGGALVAAGVVGVLWLSRLRRGGSALRLPGPGIAAAATVAWLLEAAVIWTAAGAAGVELSYAAAVVVTAATIAAQTLAVTPGGIGSYEAAATAALVGVGAAAGPALAAAILAHAVKTLYALLAGAVALVVPEPSYVGRLRLPRVLPARPVRESVARAAPVVVVMPAFNEQERVADVVRRVPSQVVGRAVLRLVVDDGSTDDTASLAVAAGARVVSLGANRGLGAALRRGLAEATALEPACVVYLDSDGEYPPEAVPDLADAVLSGRHDYVVGSRFAGRIRVMHPHRRVGNRILTCWMRWMTRRRDLTDGQSGMRAFSPRAAANAEIRHDYNYAQVLTLNLLGKGYSYGEVPIDYTFRTAGQSFVRLGRYLRMVLPAVHAELNAAPAIDASRPQSHSLTAMLGHGLDGRRSDQGSPQAGATHPAGAGRASRNHPVGGGAG